MDRTLIANTAILDGSGAAPYPGDVLVEGHARDLLLFVDVLDFTPMETLVAATRLGGEIMGRPDELGQIKPGYLADLLLLDGDPLADIKRLQNQDALLAIMKDGLLHKVPAA